MNELDRIEQDGMLAISGCVRHELRIAHFERSRKRARHQAEADAWTFAIERERDLLAKSQGRERGALFAWLEMLHAPVESFRRAA